ncbi:MAG: Asp-tRNA(Asn)/Glu-tRNA(Gln) amidotransferase subunit GatA [Candidatus Tectomicrobia bacterium]|uniref:Glutamyl-tRNA(Gln) amidotransferase subunit A n=1 Tax=Tectimicrobiota bacterium TaxID=2528274 RepID=A0A933GMQ4_UNCTE|nr:Asp-tRNA(Asn)/Glu-tRNA(Gln) amidotransferase subunit GatA [Candidatus Tectomicrobia bacterium]
MDLCELTIHELQEKLRKREVKSTEICRSVYARIAKVERDIKAYITLTEELAVKMAEEADAKFAQAGPHQPLLGIPLAIKDLICTKGIRTTCGSHILDNFIPPYNATVIDKLLDEGAVIIGKTNQDEFGMGSSTETSFFGLTHNPWNLHMIPGGSSGGSAAALAADETIGALGTDTGGSIRQPASLCGIVGLKPTYGRVSRFGLVAYASSLDQIGPMTKDVTDAAIMLNAIAGHDPFDSTSARFPVPDYTLALKSDVKGLRIGVPKEYFLEGIDPEVAEKVWAALDMLEKLGATKVEISLPHTSYAVGTYYILATAEASSNLARYDGVKYGFRTMSERDLMEMYCRTRASGFGAEVKRRIMLGTYSLSAGYYDAYYKKAQQVRSLFLHDFQEAFKKCDVLITPTSPTPAFKIGEKIDDPLQMYLSDIFTISANLGGIPGLSIPCGLSSGGLPIGLQILGNHFCEETILKAAYAFEQNTEYHHLKPKLN